MFRRLFAEHFDAVTGYAMRRADAADAADVVAETMLIAWRRLAAVPAPPATRPWLLAVARRLLANQRRGSTRRVALSDRLAHELGTMAATRVRDHAEISAERDHLRLALDGLSPDDKELLLLSVWEGLSPADIAIVLDIPAPTARTRLHRARNRLRSELSDPDEGERQASPGHFFPDGTHAVQPLLKGDR